MMQGVNWTFFITGVHNSTTVVFLELYLPSSFHERGVQLWGSSWEMYMVLPNRSRYGTVMHSMAVCYKWRLFCAPFWHGGL